MVKLAKVSTTVPESRCFHPIWTVPRSQYIRNLPLDFEPYTHTSHPFRSVANMISS